MSFDLKGCLECCDNMESLIDGNTKGATEIFGKSFMPNIRYIMDQTYFCDNQDIVFKSEKIYECCQYIRTKLIESSYGKGTWLVQSMQISGYISILSSELVKLHESL